MKINETLLVKTITWLAYAAVCVPLLFSVYFYPSHAAPQTFALRLLVEAMLFCSIVLAFKNSSYVPKLSALSWSIVAFLGAYILATLASVEPAKSFFSDFDRHWGFLTISHLFLFFFILRGVFSGREAWRRLFTVSVAASSMVALYGVYQFFFQDIGRIYGTIGNPALLSSYVLFNAIIAFWLALDMARSTREKIFFWTAVFVNAGVTLMTGTRATALAFVAALAVLFVGYLLFYRHKSKRMKKALMVAGGALICAIVLVVSFRTSDVVQKNNTLSRLVNISSSSATGQTRLFAWRAAWEGFRENPLLGVGPENFNVAFNKYFDSDFYTYEKIETEFTRAHNIFLEMLATAGIVGLIAYLAVFCSFLFLVFRRVQTGIASRHFAIAGYAFVAAYVVQGFFSMDALTSVLPLILLFAYAESLGSKEEKQPVHQASNGLSMVPLALIFAALAYAGWSFTVKPALADRALSDADAINQRLEEFEPDEALAAAETLYQEALGNALYGSDTVHASFDLFLLNFYNTFGDAGGADFRKLVLERSSPVRSDDYFSLYRAARIYNIAYLLTKQENAEIERIFKEGEALAPGRLELPYARAQLLLMKQNLDAAIALSEEGIAANKEYADFYHIVFLAYNFKNDRENALAYAQEGMRNGFTFTNVKELLWLARAYKQKNMTEEAKDFYDRARSLDPNVPPLQLL